MLRERVCFLALSVWCLCFSQIWAEEPNESFGQATLLGPGVLTVNDDITPGFVAFPDTVLGVRDTFGSVYFSDDDGSPLGDGRASGIGGVPTNSGSIDFVVSGYPDDQSDFIGNHGEFGDYEVFVDVYDFFDDLIDQFSEVRTLQPGNVDDFSFSNFEWIGGSYDVYIDNTVGGVSGGDVDFFTFTGLTAGTAFSAEVTQNPSTGFDSILGWFDSVGNLIASDDESGVGSLSKLEGVVPASGQLTFAVTGYDDFDFLGVHNQEADYSLELTVDSAANGDFDNDGDVDGRDFLVWQRGGSPTALSAADLADWQANYGNSSLAAAVVIPEPTMLGLLAMVVCVGLRGRFSR